MTQTPPHDNNFADLIADYASQAFTPDVIASIEEHGPSTELWGTAESLDLPLIGIDENRGGSGGSVLDLISVMLCAGRYSAPLPLAETSLAAWLLTQAGMDAPPGPLTLIPDPSELALHAGRLTGHADRVPWARGATAIVALLPDGAGKHCIVQIDATRVNITPGSDLAGMPRDTLDINDIGVEVNPAAIAPDDVLLRGALLRSAQIAGAVASTFELTSTYVEQRTQFGRPIGTFQAIQALVVELAGARALTELCVERAALATHVGKASFEILATKAIANRYAGLATRTAHQAHGAIGLTQEYPLQLLTRRLHTWRGDFGDEANLNARLGAAVHAAESLHSSITAAASEVAA
jgi:acyl-CoA dehydrogenase